MIVGYLFHFSLLAIMIDSSLITILFCFVKFHKAKYVPDPKHEKNNLLNPKQYNDKAEYRHAIVLYIFNWTR